MPQPLIYLDDYLNKPDFRVALRSLAAPFRASLGLPEDLDELGLVCPDVEQAAAELQSKWPGMGTFLLAEGSPIAFDEAGRPRPYRTRVGFAYYQGVLLELAEAGTGSDIFSTHLDPGGKITIHHMGYFARGDEHRISTKKYEPILDAAGFAQPEWKATVFAGLTVKVAIYDTQKVAEGLSLEFLDFRLLGLPVDYPKAGAEALAELQVHVGPRVLRLPGPADGQGTAAWSLHADIKLPGLPNEIWPWLIEPDLLAAWLDATVTVTSPGGAGEVGAVRTIHTMVDGKQITSKQTITESRTDLLLRWTADADAIFESAESVMTLTIDGAESQLVWQISFHPKHVLAGAGLVRNGNKWMCERLSALAAQLGGTAVVRSSFSPTKLQGRLPQGVVTPDQVSALAEAEAVDPGRTHRAALQTWESGVVPQISVSQCDKVDKTLHDRYAVPKADVNRPASLAALMALVRSAVAEGVPVRAVGSARSLSDAPEPSDSSLVVSTCELSSPMPEDPTLLRDASQADWLYRCGAGRTIAQVLGDLDPAPSDPTVPMRATLENLGAGDFQTIVGALSTSTHGSGLTRPSFPQLIAALQIVTVDPSGAVVAQRVEPSNGVTDPTAWSAAQAQAEIPVTLIQDDARFQASLVSLGSFGVIYAVTLKLVPGFYLQEQREVTWWSLVKTQLPTLLAENEYFELVLDPLQSLNDEGVADNLVLTSKRNTVATYSDCGARPALMKLGTTELGRLTSAILLEWALKNPPKRVPYVLKTGVNGSAVTCYTDKNYKVLMLNMDVNAASTEQNVPVEQAVVAIDAVLAHAQQNFAAFSQKFPPGSGSDFDPDTPYHEDPKALAEAWRSFPIPTSPLGIRFVPANDAPMSPMYQRATCTIEMPMTGSDALDARAYADKADADGLVALYEAYLDGRRKLFQDVEALLQSTCDARPHWGQANYLDNATTHKLFPGFETWLLQYQSGNALGTFNGAMSNRLGISVYPDVTPTVLPAGTVTGTAIFRHDRRAKVGILKFKDGLGQLLYDNLTAPVHPDRCEWLFPKKCKRMGESYIASTQNIVDPYVVEVRFTPTGEILDRTESWDLYHSFAQNRQYGTASFDGERITITGDAATGLQEYVNAGRLVSAESVLVQGPVVLRVIDLNRGRLVVEML